jgi:hypothetical protein
VFPHKILAFCGKKIYFTDMRYFTPFKKTLLCLSMGIGVLFSISCQDGDARIEEAESSENAYIEPAVEQFKEPSETKISYKKARNFNKASEALVFMGQDWAEKMAEVDDEEKLRMAASYEEAQDDLIRKFGISGKAEFKWLHTKALPDPSNKEVFARAGVWINNN